MDDRLFASQCPDRWKSKHPQRQCKKGDDAGILPFPKEGGRVVLMAQPPATVTIH